MKENYIDGLTNFHSGIKTAIDIGAAEGEYTLFFLEKTSTEKVFTFEPSDYCIKQFQENLQVK